MDGKWVIFEPKSGRYFKATYYTVMKTVYSLNKRIESDVLKWNDVFSMFGLPTLSAGEITFNYDRVSSHFDLGMGTDDFTPVVIIDYIKN